MININNMTINLIYVCTIFLCLMGGHPAFSQDLSEEKVLSMIPDGDDIGEEDLEKIDKLKALGVKIHPVLVEILHKNFEDPILVSRILDLLSSEAVQEKEIALNGISSFLKKNHKVLDKWSLIYTIESLGDLGDARAANDLIPFINHKEEIVRINALQSIGKVGLLNHTEKINAFIVDHSKNMKREEVRKDYSIREAFLAIAEIKYRDLLMSKNE